LSPFLSFHLPPSICLWMSARSSADACRVGVRAVGGVCLFLSINAGSWTLRLLLFKSSGTGYKDQTVNGNHISLSLSLSLSFILSHQLYLSLSLCLSSPLSIPLSLSLSVTLSLFLLHL